MIFFCITPLKANNKNKPNNQNFFLKKKLLKYHCIFPLLIQYYMQ